MPQAGHAARKEYCTSACMWKRKEQCRPSPHQFVSAQDLQTYVGHIPTHIWPLNKHYAESPSMVDLRPASHLLRLGSLANTQCNQCPASTSTIASCTSQRLQHHALACHNLTPTMQQDPRILHPSRHTADLGMQVASALVDAGHWCQCSACRTGSRPVPGLQGSHTHMLKLLHTITSKGHPASAQTFQGTKNYKKSTPGSNIST
eukprot:1157065-Pelagomonas_calceolata.AAC.13